MKLILHAIPTSLIYMEMDPIQGLKVKPDQMKHQKSAIYHPKPGSRFGS